jgi:uncharacterized protein involved in response to NO
MKGVAWFGVSRCRHAADQPTADIGAEPFRVFLPWAMLAGVAGVLLWPLFFAKVFPLYPALPHARLMMFGFGGGSVLGFLGTAGPKMLSAPSLRRWQVIALMLLHAATVVAGAMAHDTWCCGLFATTLLMFIVLMAMRFLERKDIPPPGFVLACLGLLCGIAGAVLCATQLDLRSPMLYRFARLLTNEGFLLLPLLGVSGFLLPMWFKLPTRHHFPDSRTPAPGWWPLAMEAFVLGALVITSLWWEASGEVRLGPALRALCVLLWWHRDLPGLWSARTNGTHTWALRLAMSFVVLSMLLRACDPAHFLALEHALFITGFGLAILLVTLRVNWGHNDQREAARGVSKPLRWMFWLAVLAMLTRVTADYVPSTQVSHYIYAALTWVGIVWLWWREVRRSKI